jgi:hypothetical protein
MQKKDEKVFGEPIQGCLAAIYQVEGLENSSSTMFSTPHLKGRLQIT